MEKRMINSFGNIVIPSHLRKEMGISGSCTLWVDVRTDFKGDKEIVIKKTNDLTDFLHKYQKWAEVISRISECAVSVVWGDRVISISNDKVTEEFTESSVTINPLLYTYLRNSSSNGVMVVSKEDIKFLGNGSGTVVAFYRINDIGNEKGFFVLIKGTKHDRENKISKPEALRRFNIINDIVVKI